MLDLSRSLFDQALDHRGANALPSQSTIYEQLGEKQRVFFYKSYRRIWVTA